MGWCLLVATRLLEFRCCVLGCFSSSAPQIKLHCHANPVGPTPLSEKETGSKSLLAEYLYECCWYVARKAPWPILVLTKLIQIQATITWKSLAFRFQRAARSRSQPIEKLTCVFSWKRCGSAWCRRAKHWSGNQIKIIWNSWWYLRGTDSDPEDDDCDLRVEHEALEDNEEF